LLHGAGESLGVVEHRRAYGFDRSDAPSYGQGSRRATAHERAGKPGERGQRVTGGASSRALVIVGGTEKAACLVAARRSAFNRHWHRSRVTTCLSCGTGAGGRADRGGDDGDGTTSQSGGLRPCDNETARPCQLLRMPSVEINDSRRRVDLIDAGAINWPSI
jgi:hypothetical protein